MNSARLDHLERLLGRLQGGDDDARQELLQATYHRLELLARKMFHESFPRLRDQHETGSILNEAVQRILRALEQECRPASPKDYFRFAALKLRQVLLDLSRKESRRPETGCQAELERAAWAPREPEDPVEMAQWAEFHRQVQRLPEEELQVVDLHYYHGLTQDETAAVLGVSQPTVHQRWKRALRRLKPWIPGASRSHDAQ